MMAMVRANEAWRECWPNDADVRIALVRHTPSIIESSGGMFDLFCVGEQPALDRLSARGWTVVALRDGWYADDGEGGVAIWGQGVYWEIRDTPFSVKEAVGPAQDVGAAGDDGDMLDVRRGIFGV